MDFSIDHPTANHDIVSADLNSDPLKCARDALACHSSLDLFKELKSHYRLKDQPSRKRHIVEILLYAAVVTLIVSRRLLTAIREKLQSLHRTIPEHRWAALFATAATEILRLLLLPPRVAHSAGTWLETMLLHEALDPNLSRKLLLARVENAAGW